ncbi:ABC transporter permease [Aureimonas endophytica]|uniref:ABC transporter permease n=1 Tax=Aureimonas endophytica TaxID=2027858 RepID=A0A916ZX93_9HYPH|nr:DMT family transporter [Aureimonas endophytica]GGE17703.1 ABC transporter permease [Aureimonas endophytica]
MPKPPAMGPLEWALLLLLSVLWGGAFFFSKLALHELPPFTVVLARVAIAALALALYLVATGRALPAGRAAWSAFLGMGLLNNLVPFSLIFWGQTQIASGLASILNATTPIFSIVIAHALTEDETLTAHRLAGIGLGIAGVALLMAGRVAAADGPPLLPMLACLGAACSYGFASVYGRRFRRMGLMPVSVAFGQTAATTLMILPVVLAVDAPWRLAVPSATVMLALGGLALLSTALAYILFFRILAVGGAINASLVTLLIPVSAILLGGLVLGERLGANHFAGMGLIALGLLAIDGRALRVLGRKAA